MREFNNLKDLIQAYRAEKNKRNFIIKTLPLYEMIFLYKIESAAYLIEGFGYAKK